ncbi:LutB/LldF family L-lactate oxidation iron-sulfur protein [candidate division KSB1 bacterium]
MESFSARVQHALKDRDLQFALDRATAHLRSRTRTAFNSLENADAVRDKARQAKLDVLKNLDRYLIQFEAKLIENGTHVHWAETGRNACGIVLDIARNRDARNIVKSKSMVTEEIELNRALIENGFHVVETDLGEYIVQLAGERPSHIIAPIIHMTRDRVGRIMHEKLGVPYSDESETLTAYAREKLRREFLNADIGISGANFGVAETGTVCIVTNEGNGRMVTTLPKIHIAIMGIEKLVPGMQDLDLMLKILARSGTGQKLTSYTTLVNGPGNSPADGSPEEVHVILLDNGRTNILAGETAEILACIRCGACLNACPVYNTIGGHAYGDVYPGPVGSIVTPGLRGLAPWKDLPYASSLCGACREVCPVRIDIPRMLLSLRSSAVSETPQPPGIRFGMKLFGFLTENPDLYRFFGRAVRIVVRALLKGEWISKLPGFLDGWTKKRDLIKPPQESFQELWKKRKKRND